MASTITRKAFFDAWIEDVREDYERYGAKSLIPKTFLWALGFGLTFSLAAPKLEFYRKPDISLVFLTAVVTINGLLLALSWNSFAKIYEIASRAKFAAFLRRENLLNSYFFQVDFIHATQIIALGFSFVTLAAMVIKGLPLGLLQFGVAGSVASSIYALANALGAVRLMQDLVWYSAVFDEVGDSLAGRPADAIPMRTVEGEVKPR